jgi:hypothetical protein
MQSATVLAIVSSFPPLGSQHNTPPGTSIAVSMQSCNRCGDLFISPFAAKTCSPCSEGKRPGREDLGDLERKFLMSIIAEMGVEHTRRPTEATRGFFADHDSPYWEMCSAMEIDGTVVARRVLSSGGNGEEGRRYRPRLRVVAQDVAQQNRRARRELTRGGKTMDGAKWNGPKPSL